MYKPTPQELIDIWFKFEEIIWKLLVVEDSIDWDTYIYYFDNDWFTIEMYYWVWVSIYPRNIEHLKQIILAFNN